MSNARDQILARLREPARPDLSIAPEERAVYRCYDWSVAERIQRFQEKMALVRGEVHLTNKQDCLSLIAQICRDKRAKNLLLSQSHPWGQAIAENQQQFPELKSYDQPIEAWKEEMFYGIDASLTTTLGGIAETGSLILWPDASEPRQMSLVPPLHIALLEVDKLFTTFAEAVKEQAWAEQGMPSNALLISGPSKSADIAQVLAYGVHGPKELVVIMIQS